jgi:hypothetical protein
VSEHEADGEHADDVESGDEISLKGSFDRRSALKKAGVAAGAAGVVWSAPKITGLSLRPDYASAATTGPGPDNVGPGNFTFNSVLPGGPTYQSDVTFPLGGGLKLHLDSHIDLGGVVQFTETKVSGPATCSITGVTFDGRTYQSGVGPANPNVPDSSTSTANSFHGSWRNDDGGGGDADYAQGGTMHIAVTCT